MFRYEALTKARGRFNFEVGQQFDLPEEEAALLLPAGAIKDLMPEAPAPPPIVDKEACDKEPEAKPATKAKAKPPATKAKAKPPEPKASTGDTEAKK